MADTHLQVNTDGTTTIRKTELWPSSKQFQQEILRKIFEQHNWKVSRIENINGSYWKIESSSTISSWRINLYISSIRDESRQPDEFKMQLGSSYPKSEEPGWINLVLGIYTISDGIHPAEYILSGYNISRYDFSTNPSIRGTRTKGLQKAKLYGMYITDKSVLFRPEFLYYYIESQANVKIQPNIHDNKSGQEYNSFRIYLTAIKSKPFLLLAGISGTGKSRIVRELARACWDEDSEEYKAQKPKNFEMVQVKPNWHDSGELIGYVSRVSGKAEFVAGDFLKFVVKAWEDLETPYFLCLDEMNLAPVEQYFAEYLSVVESRKRNEEGMVVTDPIIHPQYEHKRDESTGELIIKEWYKNLVKELLAECPTDKSYALNKQFMSEGISLPQNLIVVGTVNMDETTFSFSRKVLDRAMTIEMNEVDLYGGLTGRHEEIGKIGNNELVGTAVEGVDVYGENKNVCDKAIGYLSKLNEILEGTPFKVAYRTRNEFLLYVVNNLPYCKDKEGKELPEGYVIARALDEITSMKILSRIEGDDTKVKESLLDNLMNAIKDGLSEIAGEENPVESVSIAKLKEMKDRLNSGYTSFWS